MVLFLIFVLFIISWDGCKKLLWDWGFKIIYKYSFTVLKTRVHNQGVERTTLLWKLLGENLPMPLSAFGGSRYSMTWGSITPISVSIFTWPLICVFASNLPLPHIRALSSDLRHTLNLG